GSDENPSECHKRECDTQTQFKCNNGKCIPKLWFCDFEDDCGDNSDEPAHRCRNKNCTTGWRKCPSRNNYRCIPSWLFCDGKDDCDDRSDEKNCQDYKRKADQFKCRSSHCILGKLVCDGHKDCRDVSDEMNCPTRFPGGRHCPESQFQCNNAVCLRNDFLCDGD